MKVKGSAVQSIPKFVDTHFHDRFTEWLDSLPEESRKIMRTSFIPANVWYPFKEAIAIPTQKICSLFYDNDSRGAVEAGRFSAEHG